MLKQVIPMTESIYNRSIILKKCFTKKQQDAWRWMLMDSHGSNHIYESLKFWKDHKIKIMGILPHTINLLQPLDVFMVQLPKHWYSEARNKAVQNGNETFSKPKFLNTFNSFCRKTFKELTIRFTWKKTSFIFYNST